ncbi:MAG: carbohydrate-binding domain-containing protein [Phycisphaerales bacterium]
MTDKSNAVTAAARPMFEPLEPRLLLSASEPTSQLASQEAVEVALVASEYNQLAQQPQATQQTQLTRQMQVTQQDEVSAEQAGLELLSTSLQGDLNGDGFVGIADLNIVLTNWNLAVTAGDPLQGDPSGDGFVGIQDLNTVLGNWNQSSDVVYIELQGNSVTVNGSGVTVNGSVVTITAAGTYEISGTLNNGRIVVDTTDTDPVNLILNGVDITSADYAPIYVANAENTVITLADGTQNDLTDGAVYNLGAEDEPDAALFSHDDLEINGNGSLTVTANYDMGIVSKDDLIITSGNITVTSVGHGIRGRDSVEIVDATLTINAGGDGIQSNNDEDTEKGYITIDGGTINITADGDGIQAETDLLITGGNITTLTGGGSGSGSGGGKGIKAGTDITIEGGVINLDGSDDTVHSDGTVTISGGTLTLSTDDDAIHAEGLLTISGGDIDITTSYEGIEGGNVVISNATIDVVSSDDGITAVSADGLTSTISISGGTITVVAGADGIAAEASVSITDGDITVTTGGGHNYLVSALDSAKAIKSDAALTIDGGVFYLDTAEDGLHANGTVTVNGGTFTILAADDGIHGDTGVVINGGSIDVLTSYEGIEGAEITINDGNIRVVSSDDGINVADGADGSGGGPGGPGGGGGGDGHLYINGGYIAVYAEGDGIDVNGSWTMTAGTVIVHGPTATINGALDYDGTFLMSGGFLVAVGRSQMAQAPSPASTQEYASLTYSSWQTAGTIVHIESTSGQEVLTFMPDKAYQSVVISSPLLTAGTTYNVYSGGSSTGTEEDGLYSGGTYTPGTLMGSFTIV